jgi:hypothetical protein
MIDGSLMMSSGISAYGFMITILPLYALKFLLRTSLLCNREAGRPEAGHTRASHCVSGKAVEGYPNELHYIKTDYPSYAKSSLGHAAVESPFGGFGLGSEVRDGRRGMYLRPVDYSNFHDTGELLGPASRVTNIRRLAYGLVRYGSKLEQLAERIMVHFESFEGRLRLDPFIQFRECRTPSRQGYCLYVRLSAGVGGSTIGWKLGPMDRVRQDDRIAIL